MPRRSSAYEQAQRERIIDSAAQVFAQQGYHQTTMDQIGQALHLSKGALYLYFKTKEDLFIAALQRFNEWRFADLLAAFQPTDPALTKLEKLLERYSAQLGQHDQADIRLWLEGYLASGHIPALDAIKSESYHQFFAFLYQLLVDGQQAGELNPTLDMHRLTVALMASLDGLLLHQLVPERRDQPLASIIRDTFFPLLTNRG